MVGLSCALLIVVYMCDNTYISDPNARRKCKYVKVNIVLEGVSDLSRTDTDVGDSAKAWIFDYLSRLEQAPLAVKGLAEIAH